MLGKIFRRNRPASDTDAAERWFARMSDPACANGDRARFQHWLAASPAHAQSYAAIEQLWNESGIAIQQPALAAAARAALHAGSPRPARQAWMPALAAAAVLVLAVAGWTAWHAQQAAMPSPGTRYATITGQQRSITLTDGSNLILDTDSAVLVRFSRQRRSVELLRGRAQFNVHHNAARPFSVSADGGTVTDVGTVFQMQRNAGTVDVALLRGQVTVATRARGLAHSTALRPGEQLHYSRDGSIGPVQPIDLVTAQGWTHGKLFVHDWSLARLVAAMNRYSATKLALGDPALGNIRISGVFQTGDQQTLLAILKAGWSIHANRQSDTRIVLSRGTAAHAPAQR